MGVTRDGGLVRLVGTCGVEEAETLLALCRGDAGLSVDLSAAGPLHTAVVQALLVLALPCRGTPADAFVAELVRPALDRARAAAPHPPDLDGV